MNELTQRTAAVQSGTCTALVNADLFASWIGYLDVMPKTIETYTRAIKQFEKYLKAHGITQPQRADIIAYRDELKATKQTTTVQAYITAVKLFFQWTSLNGIYPNVADHIKGAKVDATKHKKDYLTETQEKHLLESIDTTTEKGARDYAIIALMLTTGLRTISVIRADVADIQPCGNDTALYYQGKGHEDKATVVYLAAPVEEAINHYLSFRKDKTGALFTSASNHGNGERLTTKSISRLVKEALIEAKYNSPRLTAHSLRHTFATQNLLNGGTIEETQQVLGHANINTTMIYSHALERVDNKSEKRVAAALFS